jgi:predicted enzyme related to lactoylglutathione lyase
MDSNANIVNWFEIPVSDMARAKKFYQDVFSIEMNEMETMGSVMAFFPMENMNGKVSGALVKGSKNKPGAEGALVYLNGNPDLGIALGKVEAAGGKVTMPKTKITDDIGYMAFFTDTEGNSLALHSSPDGK